MGEENQGLLSRSIAFVFQFLKISLLRSPGRVAIMSRDSDSYSTKADSTAKDSLDAKLDTKHIEVAESTPGTDPNGLATSVADIPITWFVWLVAFTASIAGMLFGYDTGIISGVLVVLHDDLNGRPTTSSEQEMITSLCSGGAFIGAIFAGNTADRVGLPVL